MIDDLIAFVSLLALCAVVAVGWFVACPFYYLRC